MANKKNKKRIDAGLRRLRADEGVQGAMFDRESSSDEVGQIFQMVADTFDDLPSDNVVKKLFNDAGFSLQNPFHFGYLIHMLADVHYSDGTVGHPPTRITFGDQLSRELNELALKHNEYRVQTLAKLYVKRPNRIASLRTWQAVKSAIRALHIKIEKPCDR